MHFTITQIEFNPILIQVDKHPPFYRGFAIVNHIHVTFSLTITPEGGRLDTFTHDSRPHAEPSCFICSRRIKRSLFYRFVDRYRHSLFQQFIHHPSIRLHWAMINPGDYND